MDINHVEVFIFKVVGGQKQFLLMKRTIQRSGFWQPLTGGVENGETACQAVVREVEEETGISIDIAQIVDSGFEFEFSGENKNFLEHVYVVEVDSNIKVCLSDEHDEYEWVSKGVALEMLKWEDDKKGLLAVCEIIYKHK